jgi:hypothetical protein
MSNEKQNEPAPVLGPAVMRAVGRELRAMYAEIIAEGVPERCGDSAQARGSEQQGLTFLPSPVRAAWPAGTLAQRLRWMAAWGAAEISRHARRHAREGSDRQPNLGARYIIG